MTKRKSKKLVKPVATKRTDVEAVTVASPYARGGFDKITRVIDTITVMHRRKQIDGRQHDAAQRYRWAFEAAHGAMRSSLNVESFTPGAAGPRTPSSPLLAAAECLNQSKRLLGAIDGLVVDQVCGRGFTIEQATVAMCGSDENGKCRDQDLRIIGSRLREGLKVLALAWFGPDRKAAPEVWRPEWARPGILNRWGEVEPRKSA